MDYATTSAAQMLGMGILGGAAKSPEPPRTLDGIAEAADRARNIRCSVERMIDRTAPFPECSENQALVGTIGRTSYSEALDLLHSEISRLEKAVELLGQHI